jgi:hypothetical protein
LYNDFHIRWEMAKCTHNVVLIVTQHVIQKLVFISWSCNEATIIDN